MVTQTDVQTMLKKFYRVDFQNVVKIHLKKIWFWVKNLKREKT